MDQKRDISDGRKALYYGGVVLSVIGALVFISTFFTFFGGFSDMVGSMDRAGVSPHGMMKRGTSMMGSFFVRPLIGMALLFVGGVLIKIGRRGLAGSGIVLDPQQAREDMEPWSRMGGGMMGDAIDESGVINKFGRAMGHTHEIVDERSQEEEDFSVKLRKLHQLYEDGIIDKVEYDKAKAEILSEV